MGCLDASPREIRNFNSRTRFIEEHWTCTLANALKHLNSLTAFKYFLIIDESVIRPDAVELQALNGVAALEAEAARIC